MSDDFKTNNIENRLNAMLSFCLLCLFINVFCNIIIIPDFFLESYNFKVQYVLYGVKMLLLCQKFCIKNAYFHDVIKW